MPNEASINDKIFANGTEISVVSDGIGNDIISLTDIAKYKSNENPGYVIQNWMRNRNVIRFIGLWEKLNNPILIASNSRQLKTKPDSTALF